VVPCMVSKIASICNLIIWRKGDLLGREGAKARAGGENEIGCAAKALPSRSLCVEP